MLQNPRMGMMYASVWLEVTPTCVSWISISANRSPEGTMLLWCIWGLCLSIPYVVLICYPFDGACNCISRQTRANLWRHCYITSSTIWDTLFLSLPCFFSFSFFIVLHSFFCFIKAHAASTAADLASRNAQNINNETHIFICRAQFTHLRTNRLIFFFFNKLSIEL